MTETPLQNAPPLVNDVLERTSMSLYKHQPRHKHALISRAYGATIFRVPQSSRRTSSQQSSTIQRVSMCRKIIIGFLASIPSTFLHVHAYSNAASRNLRNHPPLYTPCCCNIANWTRLENQSGRRGMKSASLLRSTGKSVWWMAGFPDQAQDPRGGGEVVGVVGWEWC